MGDAEGLSLIPCSDFLTPLAPERSQTELGKHRFPSEWTRGLLFGTFFLLKEFFNIHIQKASET